MSLPALLDIIIQEQKKNLVMDLRRDLVTKEAVIHLLEKNIENNKVSVTTTPTIDMEAETLWDLKREIEN